MTVEIGSMIEDDLGVKVPAMEMMDGSVTDMAHRLLALLGLAEGATPTVEMTVVQKDPSTITIVRAPSESASLKLVAIPYVAGSSAAFASWPARLGKEIELLSVQPPGRDGGSIEGLHKSVTSFVAELGPRLIRELDQPYAIYGHSLGALIAFELSRWLRAAGARQPAHLFLAAYSAPQLPNEMARFFEAWPEDIIERVSDTLWAETLHQIVPPTILEDPALLKRTIPVLAAEMEMVRQYKYKAEVPLDCPITCFAGSDDVLIPADTMKGWEVQTTSDYRLLVVPGDHLFLRSQAEVITDVVRKSLLANSGGEAESHGTIELSGTPSA
jgi:medium-chain acyl-[acyl-carrier-protein] hydrolase